MSAPTFKILIDFDEYLKLMTLKDIVKKQEEELKSYNLLRCAKELAAVFPTLP